MSWRRYPGSERDEQDGGLCSMCHNKRLVINWKARDTEGDEEFKEKRRLVNGRRETEKNRRAKWKRESKKRTGNMRKKNNCWINEPGYQRQAQKRWWKKTRR